MNILVLYPNAEGYGRIPLGMSIILTILYNAGHTIEIFDTTFMRGDNVDNTIRQRAGFVLPTDTSSLYESHNDEEIDEMLRTKVTGFSPDLVVVSIVEDNYRYAHHMLEIVKSLDKRITTLAGGSTPTVVPRIVMENSYIDYVIQGEGEEACVEFCDLLERGKSAEGIRNLWYTQNGVIKSNPVRPFVDMNTLPIQNLDFWDVRHFIKPYGGEIYKSGYYEMSRGCMNKCTYCINHSLQNCLRSAGKYYRRKSVDRLISEIKTHKEKYQLERIFFTDDNFLFMPEHTFNQFIDRWKSEISLPYWVNTTVETINAGRLEKLKASGCDGISIGVESGSEWLRRNILNRKTRNSTIINTFQLIHEYGIRTSSNIMMGFPAEHEDDVFESVKLLNIIKPKSLDVTFVTPYMGTNIHKIAWQLGYIEVMDDPGFRGFAKDINMRKPCMNTPHISNERLMDIFNLFSDYVNGKIPIPDKFLKPAPGANAQASPRDDMGKREADIMKEIISSMAKYPLYELTGGGKNN
jgi:radical SAM superfamily enzyme YgiQ (UPF0313 family)